MVGAAFPRRLEIFMFGTRTQNRVLGSLGFECAVRRVCGECARGCLGVPVFE